jgi:hypothetical protein
MLEVLLGTVIIGLVLGATSSMFTRQSSFDRRTQALDAIDAEVSRDLSWLKSYARFWEMSSGPYNLTAAQTGAASFTTSSFLNYEPTADDCAAGTLAQSFINMAASDAVTPIGTSPNQLVRPNPIPTSSGVAQSITLPAVASAYALTRTINFTGLANRIRVVYAISGSDAAQLPYPREASILVQAEAWCAS